MHIIPQDEKLAKEDLIKNKMGASFIDNILICIITPYSELLVISIICFLFKFFPSVKRFYYSKHFLNKLFVYFIDLLLVETPILLHMIWSNGREFYYAIVIILLTYIILLITQGKSTPNILSDKETKLIKSQNERELTGVFKHYHALILIMTVYCIFAVDFRLFPQKLVKTETFGMSYMDSGTGSIFMMMGMGAAYLPIIDKPFITQLKSNLIHLIPPIALGIARPISIEFFNYPHNVNEYGVHWNFFLTIAVVSLFALFISFIVNKYLFYLSIIIMLIYEFTLKSGLQDLILNTQRTNIFYENIEGIFQCIGYTVCYMLGKDFGHQIKAIQISTKNNPYRVLKLYVLTYISNLAILYFSINLLKSDPSRRMANFSYVWMTYILFHTALISYAFFYYLCVEPVFNSFILSIHNNKLMYFLAANLMVGSFNLTYNSLSFSDYHATIILSIYCAIAFSIPRLKDFLVQLLIPKKSHTKTKEN